jgi:putative ATP-binding cassette transporter
MRGIAPFLRDAWRLARPYFADSEERWSARLLLAAIVVLNLALVGMTVILNFWNRAFYNSLQEKDLKGFTDLLLFYRWDEKDGFLPGFAVIAVADLVRVLLAGQGR